MAGFLRGSATWAICVIYLLLVISISTFDQKIPREGAGGLRNEEGMLVRGLQTDEGRVVGLGMGC